jgi:hypothetical protein
MCEQRNFLNGQKIKDRLLGKSKMKGEEGEKRAKKREKEIILLPFIKNILCTLTSF